jgi:hypothetical protein
MTFLGKVLIVVQVVLSFCFMAFAGAVFAVHQNWRAQFLSSQTALESARNDMEINSGEWQAERDQLQQQIDAAEEEMRMQEIEATNANNLLLAAQRENTLLEQENQRLEGEGERAALEAAFRLAEAEDRNRENQAQQLALDAIQTELRTTNDELFAKQVELDDLRRRYQELQETGNHYLALLNQNGISPDERELGDTLSPPPPVDGQILEVQLDEAGRPRLVLLSLGEDDGLRKNHILDVYRVVDGETLYIGQVKVTSTLPDRAVADVLTENRNGIIEVDDHVTTRL